MNDALLGQDAIHAVRFSVASESKYLAEYRDDYQLIVVNANIVAHMPGAVAKLVGERTIKPYIVDPQTYAFQQDPFYVCRETVDELGRPAFVLKKSVQKMATGYGGVLLDRMAALQAVTPEDLSDPGAVVEVCANVLRFQAETVETRVRSEGVSEYLDFVNVNAGRPYALVAPYFYLEAGAWREWLDLNSRFLECSRNQVDEAYPESVLFAELVLSADLLADPDARDAIRSVYAEASCDAVLLWVDDMSEHEATPQVLNGLVSLLRGLKAADLRVLNLYGGYFSEVLAGSGASNLLWGVCHGMEYGEDRGVVPVGGGIPMAKYYLPALHRRVRYPEAARVLLAKGYLDSASMFHAEVCGCGTCRQVLNGVAENFGKFGEGEPVRFRRRGSIVELNYPTSETKDICLRHYLNRKRIEFETVRNAGLDQIVSELRAASSMYGSDFGSRGVVHLRTWADALDAL